jgi:predicted permease
MILAVAIGANTSVFSALNHLLIRPLPFRSPEKLAVFGEMNHARGIRSGVSSETFEKWAEHAQSFQALGAMLDDQVFPLPGNRESLHGARVSINFFDVLGVRPALGRTFVAADGEAGKPNVVVISNEFWSTRWARDPDALGRTLRMSNRTWTVIGVMPPGFRMVYSTASVWVPLDPESARGDRELLAVGRLKASETVVRASDELAAVQTSAEPGWAVWGKPLREYIIGDKQRLAVVLFATVALMLVTGCVNIGAVLIARATGRLKDVAIQMSLGASRWRILCDSLAEALMLSTAGSAAGLMLAIGMRRAAVAVVPELRDFAIDRTVLAFTLTLTICVTAIVASGPAIVSSRAVAAAVGRRGTGVRGAFVVAQTAFAVTLLVSVGVVVRSLAKLHATDPGFRSGGIVIGELELPSNDPGRSGAFVRMALQRAVSEPYVKGAAAATAVPLFNPDRAPIEIQGRGREETVAVAVRSISPEYLSLFDIPIRRGRHFSSTDDERSTRVAIISQRAADLFWPKDDAVGQQLRFGHSGWMRIVGVAADIRSLGLRKPPAPEVYVPFAQQPTARVSLALRVKGDPIASIPALSNVASDTDSRASVRYANSMPALLDEQLALVRALSAFGAVFATIAALLAGTGLYGAISCLYAQRTREIGIRLALGARPRRIIRLIAASSARLAGIGCLIGLCIGAVVGRLFQAAVFDVAGVDVIVCTAAMVLTAVIAIAAMYEPAARAVSIDPAAAIRCE